MKGPDQQQQHGKHGIARKLHKQTVVHHLAGTAQAQSLLQIYEAAKSHDATYKAARAQYEASLAKADQAKSALLPTAGLGYNVSRTDLGFEDYPSRDYAFNTKVGTVSASQPLYRPANLASYRQGQKSGALAQIWR